MATGCQPAEDAALIETLLFQVEKRTAAMPEKPEQRWGVRCMFWKGTWRGSLWNEMLPINKVALFQTSNHKNPLGKQWRGYPPQWFWECILNRYNENVASYMYSRANLDEHEESPRQQCGVRSKWCIGDRNLRSGSSWIKACATKGTGKWWSAFWISMMITAIRTIKKTFSTFLLRISRLKMLKRWTHRRKPR